MKKKSYLRGVMMNRISECAASIFGVFTNTGVKAMLIPFFFRERLAKMIALTLLFTDAGSVACSSAWFWSRISLAMLPATADGLDLDETFIGSMACTPYR